MITKQLIDKIEGEASIYFDMEDDIVKSSTISFPHFRGMEKILEGKNALDALVITPRVCGICGHAHLMATVNALEDAYKNAGHEVKLSQKAQTIRELTLVLEMIQNHFKWIYLVIIPELSTFSSKFEQTQLKAAYAASLVSKAIATLAGQWPHSSYMVPGGVTCDPTQIDILQVKNYIDEVIAFLEKETIGIRLETFLNFSSCKEFDDIKSDVATIENVLIENDFHKSGFAYDRFLVFGEHSFSQVSKLIKTRALSVDVKFATVEQAYSPNEKTFALNAVYKGDFYETGPLARTMSTNLLIVKNMHRRYKDSAYTRVMARIFELGSLLEHTKKLTSSIDITQESFIKPRNINEITAEGVGVVEAPRGPLIHKVVLEKGKIIKYEIITPTQWNIGSSTPKKPSPAQKAMKGLSKEKAQFVFRTFDVCSVCTTH